MEETPEPEPEAELVEAEAATVDGAEPVAETEVDVEAAPEAAADETKAVPADVS